MERYDEAFANIPAWVKAAELEYDMYIKDLLTAMVEQAPYLEQTLGQAAAEFGITPTRLSGVIRAYGMRWPRFQTAAHTANNVSARKRSALSATVVTIEGVTAPVWQHLEAREWPDYSTVKRRVDKGFTIVEAITTPRMPVSERVKKASDAQRKRKAKNARQGR